MGSAITNGCNCKCTQEQFKDENEIIKSNSNCKNLKNKNYKGKEIYTTIYRNKNNSIKDEEDNDISINKKQNEEMFYDLDEPVIETFNYDPYFINQKNNKCNISYKSNENLIIIQKESYFNLFILLIIRDLLINLINISFYYYFLFCCFYFCQKK